MAKGAKNPDKTGMRCLVCYSWEVKTKDKDGKEGFYIDHEKYCPSYTR